MLSLSGTSPFPEAHFSVVGWICSDQDPFFFQFVVCLSVTRIYLDNVTALRTIRAGPEDFLFVKSSLSEFGSPLDPVSQNPQEMGEGGF